jgi:lipoprotein-anchoring transpeptidase ErfK/SrfK
MERLSRIPVVIAKVTPALRRLAGPALLFALAPACNSPSSGSAEGAAASSAQGENRPPQAGSPHLPSELLPAPSASAPSPAPEPPRALSRFPETPEHAGPWFVVTSPAAGIYSEPSFERSAKVGWVRSGGKLPVKGEPSSRKGCTPGWFEVVGGGFVCGNFGTTNLSSPDVKFAMTTPNLNEVLPYAYARNAKHGTPLYHSVPSREQMLKYEPYLSEKKDKAVEADAGAPAPRASTGPTVVSGASQPAPGSNVGSGAALLDPGMADAGIGVEEPEKPWWQQDNIKERLHEIKLEHLEADADDILAKRMVTGFFVAIDRTFRWNDRTWYKTTKGLVTPSERFWQTGASKFKGVELDGAGLKLPIGWGYGGRKQVATYQIDPETKTTKSSKSIDRQVAIALTGKALDVGSTHYLETSEGTWLKASHVRMTEPGPAPADLGPDERWIDVDLSSQTLVAFVGSRPVYATLISSGKESKDKEKDHRTPTGEWRIREKHVTTTMDGDGTAAGDLPYSIEDVPYAMYFHRAYALHGAFWHGNYGVQMSHGCVNLSPLDAKWLFFFSSPEARPAFHGVWARPEGSGTRIVIHE